MGGARRDRPGGRGARDHLRRRRRRAGRLPRPDPRSTGCASASTSCCTARTRARRRTGSRRMQQVVQRPRRAAAHAARADRRPPRERRAEAAQRMTCWACSSRARDEDGQSTQRRAAAGPRQHPAGGRPRDDDHARAPGCCTCWPATRGTPSASMPSSRTRARRRDAPLTLRRCKRCRVLERGHPRGRPPAVAGAAAAARRAVGVRVRRLPRAAGHAGASWPSPRGHRLPTVFAEPGALRSGPLPAAARGGPDATRTRWSPSAAARASAWASTSPRSR